MCQAAEVRRIRARWPAPLAEAAAALWGLQIAKRYGFAMVELEVDALALSTTILARKMGRSPLDLVVDDICLLGDNFLSFDVFHVRRCGSTVAHLIARLPPSLGTEQLFVDVFPQSVLALAELDVS